MIEYHPDCFNSRLCGSYPIVRRASLPAATERALVAGRVGRAPRRLCRRVRDRRRRPPALSQLHFHAGGGAVISPRRRVSVKWLGGSGILVVFRGRCPVRAHATHGAAGRALR